MKLKFGYILFSLSIFGYVFGLMMAINIAMNGVTNSFFVDTVISVCLGAALILYFWMFYDLVSEKTRESYKTTWLIIMLVGIFFGSSLYFFKVYRLRLE